MAASQQFQFEELDEQSKNYLVRARQFAGQGIAGVFVPLEAVSPILSLVCGTIILVTTGLIAFDSMRDEPLAVAMLQTAGLLLGGWLILNAFRDWFAARSANYAGYFVLADQNTLWECAGKSVTATSLANLVESGGNAHFNAQGKYRHTKVSLRTIRGSRTFKIEDEVRGQQLISFLRTIGGAFGGNGQAGASSVPASGPALRGTAGDLLQPPTPRREGRASLGVFNYLLIVGVAIGGVFVFKEVNLEWRDDAVWDRINSIEPEISRAPWFRAYLHDERNVQHRDEAQRKLDAIYTAAAKGIREGTYPKTIQAGNTKITSLGGNATEKVDKELAEPFAEIVRDLAGKPLPLITISVKEKTAAGKGTSQPGAKEKGPDGAAADREKEFAKRYSLHLLRSIGEPLASFVQAPPESAGMIDVAYECERAGSGNTSAWRYTFTFSFRHATDDQAIRTVKRTHQATAAPSVASVGEIADMFALKTAGAKKIELRPIGQ